MWIEDSLESKSTDSLQEGSSTRQRKENLRGNSKEERLAIARGAHVNTTQGWRSPTTDPGLRIAAGSRRRRVPARLHPEFLLHPLSEGKAWTNGMAPEGSGIDKRGRIVSEWSSAQWVAA